MSAVGLGLAFAVSAGRWTGAPAHVVADLDGQHSVAACGRRLFRADGLGEGYLAALVNLCQGCESAEAAA